MADRKRNSESHLDEKNQNRNKTSKHIFRKRQISKPESKDSVIYVSSKSSIKALLDRSDKLIAENENEIIIYCLGAAIQRGILLALQICDKHPSFKTDVNTLTTEIIDDLEPAADDEDYEIQKRFNSALRIRVFRSDLLETEKKDS